MIAADSPCAERDSGRILRRIPCGLLEAVIGSVRLAGGETRYGVLIQRRQQPVYRSKDAGLVQAHFPPAALFSYGDLLPLAKLARLSHDALEELFDMARDDLGGEPAAPVAAKVSSANDA